MNFINDSRKSMGQIIPERVRAESEDPIVIIDGSPDAEDFQRIRSVMERRMVSRSKKGICRSSTPVAYADDWESDRADDTSDYRATTASNQVKTTSHLAHGDVGSSETIMNDGSQFIPKKRIRMTPTKPQLWTTPYTRISPYSSSNKSSPRVSHFRGSTSSGNSLRRMSNSKGAIDCRKRKDKEARYEQEFRSLIDEDILAQTETEGGITPHGRTFKAGVRMLKKIRENQKLRPDGVEMVRLKDEVASLKKKINEAKLALKEV